MSRVCAITGKKPLSGNKRSHALNATRRKWNVNLQRATIMVNGKPQRVYVSARALKTLKKAAQLIKEPSFLFLFFVKFELDFDLTKLFDK